jgi:hypothetical protein
MSKNKLLRLNVTIPVFAICGSFALSLAFAGDFPLGHYKAQDLSLVFDGKGQFHVESAGVTEVAGTYTVEQGRIELTDVSGPGACKAGQQKGTYVWSFNGTALSFIKVADSCDDRSTTLVPVTWQLQK